MGGAQKWHGYVADCMDNINALPGGLLTNWMNVCSAAGGPCGTCCLTCGDAAIGFGGGRATSSPFNNLMKHMARSMKRRAMRWLLAEIEAELGRWRRDKERTRDGDFRSELGSCQRLSNHASSSSQLARSHSARPPRAPPGARRAQPATKQEQLDAKVGVGAFTVNDDESLAGCGRCSRHMPTWIHLDHPNWLKNAVTRRTAGPSTACSGSNTLGSRRFRAAV
jgi:hypothetical protein